VNHLTMQQFGRQGRWANQLFQYAFLKTYACRYDCQLQLPPWAGNRLLHGANDPPITVKLQAAEESRNGTRGVPPRGPEYVNRDWRGYAQYHTSYYRPFRAEIERLWTPSADLSARMREPLLKLRGLGRTLIGLHLRRGDYGRQIFYVTPADWYLAWLKGHWHRFPEPVLFVASEEPALLGRFDRYGPVTAPMLDVALADTPLENYRYLDVDRRQRDPVQMDFGPDWYLLSMCDVVLAPNSTFSFTAAMRAPKLEEFWRSDLPSQRFVQLDPWDADPLTHDKAEDFRHVPGVCLNETPYWRRLADGGFEEKR